MKIEKKYKISKKDELIFAKSDLKNFFKYNEFEYKDFFLFALMELGTNILKYPKSGEIWLLRDEEDFLLAALDKGRGIFDLEWALKKGTSTKNTLGLGLYQLSKNEKFELKIFTSTDKLKGTIVLIKPKKKENIVFLTNNFLDLPYGGDFILKKGKYFILGDVNGHGRGAYLSAKEIEKIFLRNVFSCLIIDDFLKELHFKIKKEKLRGVALSILEISKFGVNICSVGSNKMFLKQQKEIKMVTFKDGILGEAFSSSSKYSLEEFDEIFLVSDGIDEKIMYNILTKTDDLHLICLASIYFSEILDDKAIIGVKNGL